MTDSLWRKRQEPEQEYHAVNAVHKGQQCYVKAQPQQEPTKQEHNILMGALKRSGKVVAQTEHHTLTSRVNDVRLHKERDEQRAEAMKMLAQPEQEPVAWLDEYGNAFPLAAKQYSVVGKHWKPLYTTPPQRKPLTDEQRSEIAFRWRDGNGTASEIIDMVEAAHNIFGGKK